MIESWLNFRKGHSSFSVKNELEGCELMFAKTKQQQQIGGYWRLLHMSSYYALSKHLYYLLFFHKKLCFTYLSHILNHYQQT